MEYAQATIAFLVAAFCLAAGLLTLLRHGTDPVFLGTVGLFLFLGVTCAAAGLSLLRRARRPPPR